MEVPGRPASGWRSRPHSCKTRWNRPCWRQASTSRWPPWLALLPVAAGLFVVELVLFYRGYPRGAQGRSLGVGLTMIPAALGYPLVAGLALFGG